MCKAEPRRAAAIEFQMDRARLAARGTTIKSPGLAWPYARYIELSAGPARQPFSAWAQPFSAWAATSARRAGPKHDPIGGGTKAAQPQALSRLGLTTAHPTTPKPYPAPPHAPTVDAAPPHRWILPLGGGAYKPRRGAPPLPETLVPIPLLSHGASQPPLPL
jgi:hypothetical protein